MLPGWTRFHPVVGSICLYKCGGHEWQTQKWKKTSQVDRTRGRLINMQIHVRLYWPRSIFTRLRPAIIDQLFLSELLQQKSQNFYSRIQNCSQIVTFYTCEIYGVYGKLITYRTARNFWGQYLLLFLQFVEIHIIKSYGTQQLDGEIHQKTSGWIHKMFNPSKVSSHAVF